MAQLRYVNLVPLGKCSVTAGTPTALSVNCGPLAGQVASQANPLPVPGTACQQFTLQADSANGGNLYLLPRGKTFSANPEAIMAQIPAGGGITFPSGLTGPGLLPENLVIDSDLGTCIFYGYGVLVG
jgi:hypothetical protein